MNFSYTYILYSLKDKKFYIGVTNNLKRRYSEHIEGRNTSTAKRLPLTLIYYEAHRSKEDAERRERYLKTSKGKAALRQILRKSLGSLKKDISGGG